jgi:TetR/AcrR family transcriptional regulator
MTVLSADAEARLPGRLRREREAQILRAAEHLFAEKGFEGTTTADIAALADLPKANVHYYFGTKEKIYLAVLDDILELWLGEADAWINPSHPPRLALAGYIRAKLALSQSRPEASRIYATELLRGAPHIKAYLHFSLRQRVATLSTTINAWVAAGQLRPVDPAHLLFCIWAMTQTYADFGVQIAAVLDKPIGEDTVFETAAATITTLVLASLMGDET